MKQYQPINLISDDWGRIEFKTLDLIVPSDRMLLNLIRAPKLDLSHIFNILVEYNPPNVDKLQAILDRNNPDILWQEITKEIDEFSCSNKLYALMSLHSYRLRQSWNAKLQSKSQSVLKEFSDQIVVKMRKQLLTPSPFDLLCMNLCAEKGINYQLYQYHKAVVDYCHHILPHPFKTVSNIDKDGRLSTFISDQYAEMKETGEVTINAHSNSDTNAYDQRRKESGRRAAVMFTDYRLSRQALMEFIDEIGEIECSEIFQERFDLNGVTETKNRSEKNNKRSRQKVFILCRCEFCCLYRSHELKRGDNQPRWHCARPKCENQYDKWEDDLERKGISLRSKTKSEYVETLYQQDL